jgi:hypothetical protein
VGTTVGAVAATGVGLVSKAVCAPADANTPSIAGKKVSKLLFIECVFKERIFITVS